MCVCVKGITMKLKWLATMVRGMVKYSGVHGVRRKIIPSPYIHDRVLINITPYMYIFIHINYSTTQYPFRPIG